MQVSSAEILFSPTVLFETPRSSCALLLTWCALRESSPLFSLSQLLAAMRFLPSPIVPVAPVPSCAVKPAAFRIPPSPPPVSRPRASTGEPEKRRKQARECPPFVRESHPKPAKSNLKWSGALGILLDLVAPFRMAYRPPFSLCL